MPPDREPQHGRGTERVRPPRQLRPDDHGSTPDLVWLSDWLAQTPTGPLDRRHGSADHELAALTASASGSGGTGPFKGGLMPSSTPG